MTTMDDNKYHNKYKLMTNNGFGIECIYIIWLPIFWCALLMNTELHNYNPIITRILHLYWDPHDDFMQKLMLKLEWLNKNNLSHVDKLTFIIQHIVCTLVYLMYSGCCGVVSTLIKTSSLMKKFLA